MAAENVNPQLEAYDKAIQDPQLAANMDAVQTLFDTGEISIAAMGGFSDEEIDAAYASASHMIEIGRMAKAIKITGTLITLEPRRARNYLLTGLALHRLGKSELAEGYYHAALDLEPDNVHALLYRGEMLLNLGQEKLAAELLQEGIDVAGEAPELRAVVSRARVIMQSIHPTDQD